MSNNPMARNTMYNNNPDILEKIGELDLAVQKLEQGSEGSGDFATKAELDTVKTDVNTRAKSVNGNKPDANGNITISIPSVSGMVKSVNSTLPDANGNVTISIPSTTGFVKSVNGALPDGTGKVTLNLFPSGTTAQRPSTGTVVGQYFFDTTLNKPLYRNATNNGWVDGTGAPVT